MSIGSRVKEEEMAEFGFKHLAIAIDRFTDVVEHIAHAVLRNKMGYKFPWDMGEIDRPTTTKERAS